MTDKARALLAEYFKMLHSNDQGDIDAWRGRVRAYLAEPVTAPAGLADALAAAVPERRSGDFGQYAERDERIIAAAMWNSGRARCIDYLRSIEAAPLTDLRDSLLEYCGGFFDPNPAQSTEGQRYDDGYNAALRCALNWLDSKARLVHNGAVYSIREGEAGAEQPADAPDVTDVGIADSPARFEGNPELLYYCTWNHGKEISRLFSNQRDLAEQVRTLQQDVAAMQQQGGELREGELAERMYTALRDQHQGEMVLQPHWVNLPPERKQRWIDAARTTLNLPQPAAPGVSK